MDSGDIILWVGLAAVAALVASNYKRCVGATGTQIMYCNGIPVGTNLSPGPCGAGTSMFGPPLGVSNQLSCLFNLFPGGM